MKLSRFIEENVMADPEWRRAYLDADATRATARALTRARIEAGLTQAALADKIGTGQAVISRIESGAVSPTLDMVTRLARGLGLRPIIAFEPATPRKRKRGGTAKRAPRGPGRRSAAR